MGNGGTATAARSLPLPEGTTRVDIRLTVESVLNDRMRQGL